MIHPLNFMLGLLLARELEPRDKVALGLLSGLTRLPAAPLLVKPVADTIGDLQEVNIKFGNLKKRIEAHRQKDNTVKLSSLLKDEEFLQAFQNAFGITIKKRRYFWFWPLAWV